MKKKLLLLCTVPGTFENILYSQPKYLSQVFDVILVSSIGIENVAKNEGVKYYTLDIKRKISVFDDAMSIVNLINILYKEKPDVIHSYTPKAGLVSAIASFVSRVPNRVHTFTGLIFPTKTGVEKLVLKLCDCLVVCLNTKIICEGIGVWQQLSTSGINDSKFSIIGNGNIAGVNLGYFSTGKLENSQKIDCFKYYEATKFVYVGRLNKDKGLKELIGAFIRLKVDCRLLIVGGVDTTNPPEPYVLEIIENNNKIKMFGFQKDIRPFLNNSDCLILPSYREGFPNVVLQAGALGIPCIVTNVPGSNEIIKNDYNGWIVEPKSTDELYFSMKKFMNINASHLQVIKKNSKTNIENKYDEKFYRKKLVKFYEQLGN